MKLERNLAMAVALCLLSSAGFAQTASDLLGPLTDERIYTPEEIVKMMKEGVEIPANMRIDYQSPREVEVSRSEAEAPYSAIPVSVEMNSVEVLSGEIGTATATAMYFNSIDLQAGNANDARIEFVALRNGLSMEEARALVDVAKDVRSSATEITYEERELACNEFFFSGRHLDAAAIKGFVSHFDKISDRTNQHYLEVYQKLSNLLPGNLADIVLNEINRKVIHTAKTDFYSQLVNDRDFAGKYMNEYCSAL